MRAALLMGYGGVDQLELGEAPEPKVGPGEIKVRVVGASINPIDWKLRAGAARPGIKLELPAILGRDAAGEVVEVGPGVTRFRAGARVTGLVMGAYGERVVAKEDAWTEVPAPARRGLGRDRGRRARRCPRARARGSTRLGAPRSRSPRRDGTRRG